MEFNNENYKEIKKACEDKNEIEFHVEKSDSVFEDSTVDATESWEAYPPTNLLPKEYAQVFAYAGNDKRGALTRLELLIHLDGGKVFYKKYEKNLVLLKVTWPTNDVTS